MVHFYLKKKKSKLRKIDTELAKLKLTYGENILAETNNYQLHITKLTDWFPVCQI